MIRLIIFSFLVAFILMAAPIGFGWRWWRPEFVVLLVIYWSMFTPQFFGLTGAFVAGLGLDLIEMSPLGLQALSMLMIAYVAFQAHQRMRNYVLWHQGVWVFILVGVFQLFSHWLNSLRGVDDASSGFLVSAIISGFMWPFLVLVLRRMQFVFRLNQ